MASEFERYRLRLGDDIGDPNTLNRRFQSIDLRLVRQEDIEKDWGEALSALQRVGLSRIDEVLLPVFNKVAELANLGAIFTARAATEIEISPGLKRLIIDETDRNAFAPAAFVAGFVDGDLGKAFLGRVESYDRASGELAVQVDRVAGTGMGATWVIHAASATDNAAAAEEAKQYRDATLSAEQNAILAMDNAVAARDVATGARDVTIVARDMTVASRDTAVAAKDTVLQNLSQLDLYYLGAFATDPVVDNTGGPLQLGMQYFNTTAGEMRVYKGAVDGWAAEYLPLGSEVASVFGRTGAVGAADGDYHASQIVVTPAGGITETRVQAALQGLDTRKSNAVDVYTKAQVDTGLAAKSDSGHSHAFSALTAIPTTLSGYGITDALPSAQKGVANGVASLAADGKIPQTQLPAIAVTDTFVVNSQASMLALTAQIGDVCVRTDLNKSYILKADPAATLVNWQELLTPTDVVQSVAGRSGNVVLTSTDISDSTSVGRLLLTAPTIAAQQSALSLVPGTNVQAYSANLTVWSGLAPSAKQDASANLDGWSALAPSSKQDALGYTAVPTTRQVATSGLAIGGGDLSVNRTINVPAAVAADYRGGTNTSKALTAGAVWGAVADVALADAATIAIDFSTGLDFSVALAGNRTLGNPTNAKAGQRGRIRIVQDATGSRTLAYGSNWKFAGGTAPTLSTAASTEDFLDYEVVSTTRIRAALTKGVPT